MKGFLHIVEILVVGITTFLVMFQFYQIPKQSTEWSNAELYVKANEIITVLDKKNTDWFNSTEAERSLKMVSSNSTVFGLKMKDAFRPQINVSCICSIAEFGQLKDALAAFEVNGQSASFNLSRIKPESIYFPHDQDVIVAFDYNLTENYTQIEKFLDADKGIIEFRKLDYSDLDGDWMNGHSVQREVFNLKWDSTLDPSGKSVFLQEESSEPYYSIYKYFHNIPIFQDNFSDGNDDGWSRQSSSWWVSANYKYVGENATGPGSVSRTLSDIEFQGRYNVKADFRFMSTTGSGSINNSGIILYWEDMSNHVLVNFSQSGTVAVWENSSGNPVRKGEKSYSLSSGKWYEARIITTQYGRLKVYVNGTLVLTSEAVDVPATSQIGLGVEYARTGFDKVSVSFSESHEFADLAINGQEVNVNDGNPKKVILNNTAPACIVNSHIVNNKGRAAWLAYSDPSVNKDVSNMLRTLVIWAAGNEYEVVPSQSKNLVAKASLYKIYDQDMFQPVEIELSMGYLF